MKPFAGTADGMLGPNLYGYIHPEYVRLGEKGGKYLLGSGMIRQRARNTSGDPLLPVWSDEHDLLTVACPPSIQLKTVEEAAPNDERLVWVDRIERDPSKYRHDHHPMDAEILAEKWLAKLRRTFENHIQDAVVFDSIPRDKAKSLRDRAKNIPFSTGMFGMGGKSVLWDGNRANPAGTSVGARVTLPIFDEKDQTWKHWSLSSTSKILKDLEAAGKIKRTQDGRVYLADKSPLMLRAPENEVEESDP